MVTKENIREVLQVQPIEKNAKCALCEEAIDPSEKIMLVLSIKVTLMKVKKPIHRACAQEVLTGAQGILDEADAKARA